MSRYYKISNQMLYTATISPTTGPWSPVFIVGTDFNFGNTYPADVASNWTGVTPKANRALAGNTVFMRGNYFGEPYSNNGNIVSQKVSDRFSENSNLTFFMVDMNLWDLSESGRPRGSHTPVTNAEYTDFARSGHWRHVPYSSMTDNTVASDVTFITNNSSYTNNQSYWNTNTNLYGTEVWHSSWLSGVITPASNNCFDKLAAWSLIDEAYNSNVHRDYASNQISVSGHYSFCTAAEGATSNARLKMVSLCTNSDTHWSNLSSVLNVLNGNNYNTAPSRVWTTPNMVKWFKQKIGTTSDKMIIPWIAGWATSLPISYYYFYGSIVEGARGILWYQYHDTNVYTNNDYSSYTHQKAIRSDFTNNRVFRSIGSFPTSYYTGGKDEDFILNGNFVSSTFRSNPDFTRTGAELTNFSLYGIVLSNQFSALVHKRLGNYRIFVVNHEHGDGSSGSFTLRIDTNELSDSGWTKAVDNAGYLYNLSADTESASYKVLTDTMNSNTYYKIYEIGSAVQNLV